MPKNEPEYGCLECSRGMAQEKSAMKIPQQTTRTGGYTSNLSGGKKTFFLFLSINFLVLQQQAPAHYAANSCLQEPCDLYLKRVIITIMIIALFHLKMIFSDIRPAKAIVTKFS